MSRKDFELIAAAIRVEWDDESDRKIKRGLALAAYRIGSQLKHAHERFDLPRFLIACGVQS